MDKARLTELTARAEKAKELAEEIEALDKADPLAINVALRFQISNADALPRRMLEAVINRGRKSLMNDKEAELERLLGGDAATLETLPAPVVLIDTPPSQTPSYEGQSSCDQPSQPFAEVSCAN